MLFLHVTFAKSDWTEYHWLRCPYHGINNRNLKTLEVDLETFERLAPLARETGVFLVAESGVHSLEDARRMVQAGVDALLVGTELMAGPQRLGDSEAICKRIMD